MWDGPRERNTFDIEKLNDPIPKTTLRVDVCILKSQIMRCQRCLNECQSMSCFNLDSEVTVMAAILEPVVVS